MKSKHLAASIGILSILLLTACGGSSSSSSENTDTIKPGKVVYNSDNFSIKIPKEWQTIDKSSFTSNVPSETLIGFRNNIKSDIFTANVNISQKTLTQKEGLSVKDYAKSTLQVSKNNLIGYQLLNEKDGKMKYSKDVLATYMTEFEGKKSASERIIRFRQLYVINNGIAYTITGAYLPTEDENIVNTVGEMLDSFSLK